MGKFSPVAIAPQYMKTFACIGSACEENCCHGWTVNIDKQTFKKYRNIQIRELRDTLRSVMVKAESPANAAMHARIKLDEKGACPLLDQNNLCGIHARLGADYLSKTCQTYPRYFIQKDSELRLYATLSCPEAARKTLLAPDAMTMAPMDLSFPNESAIPLATRIVTKTPAPDLARELSQYIFETAVHLIRAPEHRSWEAMIILGLMMRRMGRYLNGTDCEDPRAAMVDTMLQFIDAGYLKEAKELVQGIAIERSHQIRLLRGVLSVYFTSQSGRSSYRQTIADAMEGIAFDENDPKGSEARYNAAEERWFAPFDDAHPHILKNYLINDLGKNCLPAGTHASLEKEFLDLAVRFSLIRMTLIGIAGLKKDQFGEADYVRVIYTFSRNIEHNQTFMHSLLDIMERDGLGNIATAALLMR